MIMGETRAPLTVEQLEENYNSADDDLDTYRNLPQVKEIRIDSVSSIDQTFRQSTANANNSRITNVAMQNNLKPEIVKLNDGRGPVCVQFEA